MIGTLEVCSEDSETTDSIKTHLLGLEGTTLCQQKLYFAGKLLESGRTLESYGIRANDILNFTIRFGHCICGRCTKSLRSEDT